MAGNYHVLSVPEVRLASHSLMAKMDAFMQDGVDKGMFSAHNKVVAMAIASIMVADKAEPAETSEQALYDRERRAFLASCPNRCYSADDRKNAGRLAAYFKRNYFICGSVYIARVMAYQQYRQVPPFCLAFYQPGNICAPCVIRLEKGSSSNRASGSASKVRSSAMRACCPPEGFRDRASPSPPVRLCARPLLFEICAPPRTEVGKPKPRLSPTLRWGNNKGCWNISPTRRLSAGKLSICRPFSQIWPSASTPSVGIPAIQRSSVDFPAPLGALNTHISPLAISRFSGEK